MTQIVLRNSIDTVQMNILKGLFDSWNVAVEIKEEKKVETKTFSQLFSKTRGMWQDHDIDAGKLRNEVWGIDEQPTV